MIDTPLMRQYASIKAKYPDALLLFRVGDFYETFGEDAVKTSKILGIVLTRRANGAATFVELAGFPYHALDTYLPKLVRAGQRVAICDQLEDPKLAKKIVKRGVTELVTPGVSYNDKILEHKENNFLCSLHLGEKTSGAAFLDISTGEFYAAQGNNDYIDKLLQGFKPSEVVIQKTKRERFQQLFGNKFYTYTFDDWVFTEEFAGDILTRHFGTTSLKGFGVEAMPIAIIAAGGAFHYLAETHHDKIQHIVKISRIEEDKYVWLDRFTVRNLELVSSINEKGRTLLDVIDRTITPMGSRMMRRWIVLPLKEKKPIEERLETVEYLINHEELAENLARQLKITGDLERIISKVSVGRVTPREVVQFRRALYAAEEIKNLAGTTGHPVLQKISEQLNPCKIIRDRIENEIQDDPPATVAKGGVMKTAVSPELDELRDLLFSGKDYLQKLQQREIANTGITSLKVGYNNIFGYYLEVTNAHKEKVPAEWNRKQTLVGSERYITEELKEYEQKILGAEEKILELESRLFDELIQGIRDYIRPVQLNANWIAHLDCLLSFAIIAKENKYTKPGINEGFAIEIREGRHPVIELELPLGEKYVTNDISLDHEKQQIIIITGPNMSGKSALLRQTALIVLMAQLGSFVPAEEANIGMVDKIFTRVGASDNISSGESTFMVEMNETASILNNISTRSLILLDEIGRGTSTYDGISIAWAITEFLHEHPVYRPKVLFATHYHELNEMAATFKRIRNFHISVKEIGNQVIFLRKLRKGGSEHSFGIHVARLAGMPPKVIERANELLKVLERSHSNDELAKMAKEIGASDKDQFQLSFIQLDDPLLEQIKQDILHTDIDNLTPVEALMKLHTIRKRLSGG
ncbi:MAG TPA: DNA mismatch repair protein MutS [Bacteroidales bacterium]|nr:DNA mismatch repair protein MutS [Bacteroidales bacterium]HPI86013.1 DNA mismatch repair protein MutS [Bacteroidales bacterium]HPM92602.1 DNA mismatch repair protein MutS [Bacteroidales bacterium]